MSSSSRSSSKNNNRSIQDILEGFNSLFNKAIERKEQRDDEAIINALALMSKSTSITASTNSTKNSNQEITTRMLKETKIAKAVKSLRQHHSNGDIVRSASALLKKWKKEIKAAAVAAASIRVVKQEENENFPPTSSSSLFSSELEVSSSIMMTIKKEEKDFSSFSNNTNKRTNTRTNTVTAASNSVSSSGSEPIVRQVKRELGAYVNANATTARASKTTATNAVASASASVPIMRQVKRKLEASATTISATGTKANNHTTTRSSKQPKHRHKQEEQEQEFSMAYDEQEEDKEKNMRRGSIIRPSPIQHNNDNNHNNSSENSDDSDSNSDSDAFQFTRQRFTRGKTKPGTSSNSRSITRSTMSTSNSTAVSNSSSSNCSGGRQGQNTPKLNPTTAKKRAIYKAASDSDSDSNNNSDRSSSSDAFNFTTHKFARGKTSSVTSSKAVKRLRKPSPKPKSRPIKATWSGKKTTKKRINDKGRQYSSSDDERDSDVGYDNGDSDSEDESESDNDNDNDCDNVIRKPLTTSTRNKRQPRQLRQQPNKKYLDTDDGSDDELFDSTATTVTVRPASKSNTSHDQAEDNLNDFPSSSSVSPHLSTYPSISSDESINQPNNDNTSIVFKWDLITRQKKLPWGHDIAFCCYLCNCCQEKKDKYGSKIISCENTADGNKEMHHRICCHPLRTGTSEIDEYGGGHGGNDDWISPILRAACDAPFQTKEPLHITRAECEKKTKMAEMYEKTEMARMRMTAKENMVYTNKKYAKCCKRFRKICRRVETNHDSYRRGPLVVLDLFSGIGSAILVLKKLQIAIKTVISVEHDRIAEHVTKHNHDAEYNNEKSDDGINHVYRYTKFEDVEDNLDAIMKEYGPFDLVVGGAPCNDYTQINATRKGTKGQSGSYLVRLGALIANIKKHPLQSSTDCYFLSENVIFDKDMDEVNEAYGGIPPVQIDAKDFSPCKRARNYWVNLPVGAVDGHTAQAEASPTNLENGFKMPAKCLDPTLNLVVKANTFMGSKSRLDDIPRMMVVKKCPDNDALYEVGTFSTADRETMLGFPVGYVSKALEHLYSTLKKDAFQAELSPGMHWFDSLPKRFHHFMACTYSFKNSEDFYDISIQHEDSTSSFDCQQYAKHLLGNAWSIPVVEVLLKPLTKICTTRVYDDFEYSFNWPPHNLV